jgi:tRNA 5-methylaminomethyl-2-thiouridine biosynthesis bifunctional protein
LRLTRIAFLLAQSRWGDVWNQHGIFQPTKKDKVFDRAEMLDYLSALELDGSMALPLSADEASEICGIAQSGVWLPRGASLNLSDATNQALKNHDRLSCIWNTHVTRLENLNNQWLLFNEMNEVIVSADKLVIAAAMESKALLGSIGIRVPLKPVRGQLSIFSIEKNDPWVEKLPNVGISGDGYCLPAEQMSDGSYRWIVGSTFDEGEDDLSSRGVSDDFNREQAKGLVDYAQGKPEGLQSSGDFVGVRCVAGDRLPMIGALTQRPGIYLATALGSRGVLWSALAAKLISAQVLEEDLGLLTRFGFAADLVAALAPARFFAGALAAPAALGALASNSKPVFPSAPKTR